MAHKECYLLVDLLTCCLTKQLEHLIAVFKLNRAEIGIYFPFDYLSLNNREVNYLVIMVQREAQSQSVTKWKLDGANMSDYGECVTRETSDSDIFLEC